ncbi:MAG: CRISPR-associated endonuclease Cas1 [Verrucomicrobiota bacterium JB023]|nr:CRISPR-associated endonuclease Cas1 [Verrucomicrobiota bacterium JB023]
MPSAWLTLPRATVRLVSRRLDVSGVDEENEKVARQIPLRDLDRLIVTSGITLTGPALAALMDEEIPVVHMNHSGSRFLGSTLSPANHHAPARLLQYEISRSPERSLPLAAKLIAAKIRNQRRLLQRLCNDRKVDSATELARLNALHQRAHHPSDDSELLGLEGAASATYLSAWARLLPTDFPFEKRSRRPPLNPVNAVLSFISAVLTNEMTALLHAHGLDPALPVFHCADSGRPSLALDLIEPFRPVVAEALTLDLFSRQMLQSNHFQPTDDGGIHLNPEGRSKLILQYEKRVQREFLSTQRQHRTSLRQQLDFAVLNFKSALAQSPNLSPFLIN